MTNFFPHFGRQNYRPYYYVPKAIPASPQSAISKPTEEKTTSKSYTINNTEIKLVFEFHGIKLYTDDILILLLIFFLYKEKVDDKLLIIALFSLLL